VRLLKDKASDPAPGPAAGRTGMNAAAEGQAADLANIPRTASEVVGEIVALVATLAGLGYVLAVWSGLPDRVPTHFTLSGKPDGWGGKNTLLLLPLIAVVMYGLLTILARFPRMFNYPVKPTPAQLPFQYRLARWLLTWIKAGIAVMFGLLGAVSAAMSGADGPAQQGLTRWVLVLVMAGVVGELALVLAYFARAGRGRRAGSGTRGGPEAGGGTSWPDS
jgi:uncharacterized membrane protein